LDVEKKTTGKGTVLRAKVTGSKSMSHWKENLLKCVHDTIKAIIGSKDCKSKYHADGKPSNGTVGSLQPHPKKEQFPVSSGKTPRVQDLIAWT
jgi:hypothetical protein